MNGLLTRPDPGGGRPPGEAGEHGSLLDPGRVAGWREHLADSRVPAGDAARIDLIAELERVKAAAAAMQARLTAAMADDATAGAGTRDAQASAVRSVAGQVGLARRISPARAATAVGLARMLCTDLPGTLDALTGGLISEWRATLVARETATLSPAEGGWWTPGWPDGSDNWGIGRWAGRPAGWPTRPIRGRWPGG